MRQIRTARARVLVLAVTLVLSAACAGKAGYSTDPHILNLQRADEAVVAVGTFQHAVIELNKVQTGTPPHALVSDADTRIVVDAATDALTTLKQTPNGWRPTVATVVDRVENRLNADAKQKVSLYLNVLKAFLAQGDH